MWSLTFVVDAPRFDRALRVGEADEPALVQAFVPERPVEALDEGILHGLPRVDEVE